MKAKVWLRDEREHNAIPCMLERDDMPAFFMERIHDAAAQGGEMAFECVVMHGLF